MIGLLITAQDIRIGEGLGSRVSRCPLARGTSLQLSKFLQPLPDTLPRLLYRNLGSTIVVSRPCLISLPKATMSSSATGGRQQISVSWLQSSLMSLTPPKHAKYSGPSVDRLGAIKFQPITFQCLV